ncbi:MAG: glycosyltransferase family 4 protein, partial [Candidatus Dormibacteraceae bacterium]
FSVYLWAALFLLQHGRSFDAVLDCQNGIPFFAPAFLLGRPTAVVLLIHHVHRDQFVTRFRWPLRTIGVLLEGPISRVVYGHRPIITVSPYTRAEVRRRLRLKGPIFVVPNGVATDLPAGLPDRSEQRRLIYVGRLVSHKRLPLLVAAVAELRWRGIDLTLDVVGSGPMRPALEREVQRRHLTGVVRFWGRVADDQRTLLLAAAWLLVTPSAGEGWGLTVIEANLVGRPALAFRVPGLVDSIVPGRNGWLVDREDGLPGALEAALGVLAQPAQQERLGASCCAWAHRFSWTRTVQRVAAVVEEASIQRQDAHGISAFRRATDVATVIRLEVSDGLDSIRRRLVPCDLWSLDGSTLQVLLEGRDMEAAAAYLQDLGLSGRAQARVALAVDLLFGPGAASELEPAAGPVGRRSQATSTDTSSRQSGGWSEEPLAATPDRPGGLQ